MSELEIKLAAARALGEERAGTAASSTGTSPHPLPLPTEKQGTSLVAERQGEDTRVTRESRWRRVRLQCGDFWLNYLFWHAEHALPIVRWTRGFYLFFAWYFARGMRARALANARRLLGEEAPPGQCGRVARQVIRNFYLFVYDVGRALRLSDEELHERISTIEGCENYLATRATSTGAILVTAHMGSFEVGMVALRRMEEKIHVVFQRDRKARFEKLRTALHRKLQVSEAAIDDGWTIWLRLREALRNNEVVLIQGDRVMPGQKGLKVPFLGGHTLLPSGPIKLALASGAPLVPIFTIRQRDGRVRLVIEPPIVVEAYEGEMAEHPALRKLAEVIERHVRANPEQWLALHYVCVEDEPMVAGCSLVDG